MIDSANHSSSQNIVNNSDGEASFAEKTKPRLDNLEASIPGNSE